MEGELATGDFYNVSFTDLHGGFGSAFYVGQSSDDDVASSVRFFGCQILRNSAREKFPVFVVGWNFIRAELHDCLFANNEGTALLVWWSGDVRIVRCTFRENTGSPAFPDFGSAVVIHNIASRSVSISDSLFERNIATPESNSGGALTLAQGTMLLTNVSFLANTALSVAGGAALDIQKGAKVTMINCFALGNDAKTANRGGFYLLDSQLEVINSECQRVGRGRGRQPACFRLPFCYRGGPTIVLSRTSVHLQPGTFAESHCNSHNFGVYGELAVFSAYNSVFRDNTAGDSAAIYLGSKARGSLTDCLVSGNVATSTTGALRVEGGATMSISRTTFRDNRAADWGGCFQIMSLGTVTVDDSDIISCWCDGSGGMSNMEDASLVITNSRLIGNGAAGKSGLARLGTAGSSVRIAGSTITGTSSGADAFAIHVGIGEPIPDFALLLDTVVVDGSVDIISHTKVLVQNCKGFNSTAVQNASVGTCQSTTDYCLAESCSGDRVGINCICDVDGVLNPFPTDCMQSAVIEARRSPFPTDFLSNPPGVPIRSAFYASFCPPPLPLTQIPVPSTHTLTYIISKPLTETAEIVLSNVRACASPAISNT